MISNFLKNSLYSISVKDYQDKYNFTVESYSEEDLNKKIDDIKKAFIHLPKLLLNSEYEDLIKHKFVSDDTQAFFKEYVKKADLYKKFDNKYDVKSDKFPETKKNKI